jgi:membrane associated rhomboid family serine protease
MSIQQYRPARFNLLPEVVKNILIINGIFYLATVVLHNQGIDLTDTLGLHYFQSDKFRWYQVITYMFMHGSFAHIFFNMFALWMFGAAIENVWGPKKFLTFYLVAGVGAAITHYAIVYFEMQPAVTFVNDYISAPSNDKLQTLVSSDAFKSFSSSEIIDHYNEFTQRYNEVAKTNMDQAITLSVDYMRELRADVFNTPVIIGASGAVFGLLLAFGMLFPNSVIYLYFFVPIRAKYFVILYGAIELFSGITQSSGDNVAHFAHLGGLLFGFLLIMYWRWKEKHNRRDDFFRY